MRSEYTADGIADNLGAALQILGRSRVWLAREIGVRPNTVTSWLSGESVPSVEHLIKLAHVTGYAPQMLLIGKKKRRKGK